MKKNYLIRITILCLIAIFLFPFKNVLATKLTVDKVLDLKHDSDKVTEGCCFVGTDMIATCEVHLTGNKSTDWGDAYLHKFDLTNKTSQRLENSKVHRTGNHSNSMTYDEKRSKIIVASAGMDVYTVDLQNRVIKPDKKDIPLTRSCNSI